MLGRIQGRLTELGITENEASMRAGLERSYLGQLRRKADRWPTVDNLQAICDAVGLRLSWVTTGLGRRLVEEPDFSSDIADVPLVSWVAASPFSEIPVSEAKLDAPHILAPNLGRGDFIALKVKGDSMDRIAPDGAIIIVNRADTTLVSRAFYVFCRQDGAEATFKRWMTNPNRLEPFSTNPTHEPVFVITPPAVIGRVRKIMLDL